MKIGILGAMLEEVSSIRRMMNIQDERTIGQRTYITGTIENNEVVLTFSRWGKVASSSTTTTLINRFNVDFILFLGVAGAVDKKLNIGDVVIGSSFYQHDMDARPLFKQFQIPLTGTILFKPSSVDVINANQASEQFIQNITGIISPQLLQKYSIFKPKVYCGTIASGDKFVTDVDGCQELSCTQENNGVLAVEMEGAAVAQVCQEHEIPFIIIRTISDKADHSAAIDFKSFIDDIACKYSSGILYEYLKLLPSKQLQAPESKVDYEHDQMQIIASL